MHWMIPIASMAMLVAGAAQADDRMATANGVNGKALTGVGQGIICDTSAQAERFIALRNGGWEAVRALQTVNTEASDPRACGNAIIAFTEGEQLGEQHMQGKPVSIVKIKVIAVNDGDKWVQVPAKVQFTILEADGIDV
jgi:hypothetical protein